MSEQMERNKEPFDEILIAKNNQNAFSIKGIRGSTALTEHQFRLLLLLKRAKGNVVSRDRIRDFIYGEPDKDLPMSNVEHVQIARLRTKLEKGSAGRFSIGISPRYGWYLTDATGPELLYPDHEVGQTILITNRKIVAQRKKGA